MHRIIFLLIFLSVSPVLAQETQEADADTAAESSTQAPARTTDGDDDLDDVDDLDELYPVEDEDAFIPSENVAFGQSIPFPTDI